MLALKLQRLILFDVRDVGIPIVVGIGKLGKSVIVRRHFHPRIIDFYFLERLRVVINNHSARADHRHLPDFFGIQPAVVNKGATILGEIQVHHRYIFNLTTDMAVSLAGHAQRQFLKQIQENGDIMRGQIPGDIDISLEQTEVESSSCDVLNLANIARINNFLHPPNCW